MKTIFTFLFIVAISTVSIAQYELPVTWENEDETASWTPFENDGDAPENFVIVDNPDNTGINSSDKALQYTVLPTAQPWVGAWSTAYGELEFTEDNYILQMMVYKDVISDCALKVEADGMDFVEVHVENTLINEWELLTFDFTDAIGTTRPTLVFFPDFPSSRTEGSLCYVDNIGWYEGTVSIKEHSNKISVNVYPNPTSDKIIVNYPGITELKISNALGQTVKNEKFTAINSKTTDVSDLTKGVYYVSIKTADGIASSKFVKE